MSLFETPTPMSLSSNTLETLFPLIGVNHVVLNIVNKLANESNEPKICEPINYRKQLQYKK